MLSFGCFTRLYLHSLTYIPANKTDTAKQMFQKNVANQQKSASSKRAMSALRIVQEEDLG